MTPREWRGIRIGARLIRLAGGMCFLHAFGRSTASVRFPNGQTTQMSIEQLYARYRPA